MGVSSHESSKAKGVKGVDNLSVGVVYFYSPKLDQHEKNEEKVVDDDHAEAVAKMLVADAEAGVAQDLEGKARAAAIKQKFNSILSAKDRFKSPRNGAFFTVERIDGAIWILA